MVRLTNINRTRGTLDIEVAAGASELFHCTWDNWGEVLKNVFRKYNIAPELEEEFRRNGGKLEF